MPSYNWQATVTTTQAVLARTTGATHTTGGALVAALQTAGNAYAAAIATDPAQQTPAFLAAVAAWAVTAQPAWVALDLISRTTLARLAGSPPSIVPFDPTLATVSNLTTNAAVASSAAASIPEFAAPLAAASSAWSAQFAAVPIPTLVVSADTSVAAYAAVLAAGNACSAWMCTLPIGT
jgi:hypothetical protein